ncbi:hypothetical protein NL108_017543 [Boleophthalmus pectinirostris]|nr:hypothetical protein NL108_017543 [Boleophthalmus pectinirostris]
MPRGCFLKIFPLKKTSQIRSTSPNEPKLVRLTCLCFLVEQQYLQLSTQMFPVKTTGHPHLKSHHELVKHKSTGNSSSNSDKEEHSPQLRSLRTGSAVWSLVRRLRPPCAGSRR